VQGSGKSYTCHSSDQPMCQNTKDAFDIVRVAAGSIRTVDEIRSRPDIGLYAELSRGLHPNQSAREWRKVRFSKRGRTEP
jgi:hypothetical protein